MTETPIDLALYFNLQEFLRIKPDKSASNIGATSKAGSQFCSQFPVFPDKDYDEVFPNIFLGNKKVVQDYTKLKSMGVSHMVNCSMGPKFNQVNTSQEFYKQYDIVFHGIPAMDQASFQILPYLRDAVAFIQQALKSNGTVYVHCQQGVSRSATVVIAFLMLTQDMDAMAATQLVRQKRLVSPNNGFLRQLCELQEEINASGKTTPQEDCDGFV